MATTIADITASSQSAASNKTTTKSGTDELGKDAFLKLLMVQLSNQDPLNPMSDTDFIAQMAQFSALEQMTNLNTSMSAVRASSMIGKFVTWGENGDEVGGIVTATLTVNGEPTLLVGNRSVKLSEVLSVTEQITQAKLLVGKYITWQENGKAVGGMVESATSADGRAVLHVGDKQIALDDVLSVGNAPAE
ncbi:MAG: flagellar hook capping FlgD N-terminal domain-containing protein [Sporomusaceae bacterium]|nr:flagellar hook capping FlgD N-terminal domain-containing protein [Sporomusaceae bacterium]